MNEVIQNNPKLKNYENNKNNNENIEFISIKNSNINILNTENNKNIIEKKNSCSLSELSRYKSTKLLGINFYHIGNTYVFGFINGFSTPLFCIDDVWYWHFIIYLIEIIIYNVGNNYFYNKIEHWKQLTFNILLITFFIFYTILILINPGIVLKNEKDYKHTGFCSKCNIYYLPEEIIEHCPSCEICVRKLDHHCHAIRKCITKNNIAVFTLIFQKFSKKFNFLEGKKFQIFNGF